MKYYIITRNSWGDKGHIKVTDSYALAFRDVWIGTKMDELI